MEKNMGLADRILRITAAVTMMVLYEMGIVGDTTGIVLLVLSVIFFLTGFISICPIYLPFGIHTLNKKQKSKIIE
jgi:hypothetical protein